MAYELKLFSGNANRPLAEEIAQYLHVPVCDAEVTRFSNGEVYVQVNENVRGADVFLIQPTCPPANDTLMELLIMVDAMKRASARRITAVLPYYGYARQDRKVQPRVPISAKLVADLLEAAGIDRLLALDLHAGQIQGFFSVPVDHLFAGPVVMIDYLRKKDLQDPVIVAPDAGGVERARAMAKRFDAGLAIIDKRREGPNSAVAMHLIGDVKGRDAIVIDDIVDTAGTLLQAVTAVEREGARRILACGVHAVLSGPAITRIKASPIEEIVVTNSIPVTEDKRAAARITVLTVAPLLGEAGNGARLAIIRELQFDPVTELLLHVDLQEVSVDRAITVQVTVRAVGEAAGVREQKGILNLVLHELTVSCLPTAIPERIEADVSALMIGDVLTVAELRAPEGVRILNDPGQAVATVAPPMAEEVAAVVAPTAAAVTEPEGLTERKPEEGEGAAADEGKG